MTTVLTTGHAFSDFEALRCVLAASGVAQAVPFDSVGATVSDLASRLQSDPDLRAVLVYESPTICLAHALNSMAAGEAASPSPLLEEWRRASEVMLGLSIRQPDRCVLVSGSAALSDPARFIGECDRVLGLGVGSVTPASGEFASKFPPLSMLETLLADSMVAVDEDVSALFDELESCAHLGLLPPGPLAATGAAAWSDYAALRADASRSEALAKAAQEVAELTEAKASLEQRCEALLHERDRHAELVVKAGRVLDTKLAELAHVSSLSEHLQRECESLLLQLHEAHVQSEAFFGQTESLRPELLAAQEERDVLKTRLAAALESGTAQRVQLLVHAGALDQGREQLSRTEAEKKALASQLSTCLAETEQLRVQLATEAEARHAEAEQHRAELAARAAAAHATAEDHAAKLAQHAGTHQAEAARHEETRQALERVRLQAAQLTARVASLDGANHVNATRLAETDAARSLLYAYWREQQPAELVIDLRRPIHGSNWHHAEPDGRWTGPERVSTLTLPALSPGNYTLELQVVGAMDRDINAGLKVDLNGTPIPIAFDRVKHPSVASATFTTDALGTGANWVLSLTVPKVRSPAERGGPDQRQLGVRVGRVKFITLQKG